MADNESNQPSDQLPTRKRWQYSLLSLLIATTVLAISLTFGVHYPRFTILLLTLSVVQAAAMFLADWLIRPARRRSMAIVIVGAWAALGSVLLLFGARELFDGAQTNAGYSSWTIAICLICMGAFCYCVAWRRWHGVTIG